MTVGKHYFHTNYYFLFLNKQMALVSYLWIRNLREWLLRGCGEITRIKRCVVFGSVWVTLWDNLNLPHDWPTHLESLYTIQTIVKTSHLNTFSTICSDMYHSTVGCTPGNLWPASLTAGNTAIYHPSRRSGGILQLSCCSLSLFEGKKDKLFVTDEIPLTWPTLIITSTLLLAVTLFQSSDPFLPRVVVGGENVEVVVVIKNLKEKTTTFESVAHCTQKAEKIIPDEVRSWPEKGTCSCMVLGHHSI